MAFEPPTDGELPQHSTVAGYSVDRLGLIPVVSVKYAETVNDGTNVFGLAAQRAAKGGRFWLLNFAADTPEQVAAMGQMLVGIMLAIGRTLLTQLGISDTITDDDLLTAVQAMDNVDSFIATALEDLERNRRLSLGPRLTVMGDAPAVTPPPPPQTSLKTVTFDAIAE